MHYLVTGGCGFIGSHLSHALVKAGHDVTILDDLSSGKREKAPAKARLLVRDITAAGVWDDVLAHIDGCFHLAAIISVQQSAETLIRAREVNAQGTQALLAAITSLAHKPPVVFTSSAAVYGDNPQSPLRETSQCHPISAYGKDKYGGEQALRAAHARCGLASAVLRFFNVYGALSEYSAYASVISVFAERMQTHQPVTIFGDGEQTRDFVHISDAVRALMQAMVALKTGAIMQDTFNVCTGIPTTVNALAREISALTNSRSPLQYAPHRPGDILYSLGDNSRAMARLHLPTPLSLAQGLRLR